MLHFLHPSNAEGLVFRLDYKKTIDFINLDLVPGLINFRGFGDEWVRWIHAITRVGFVGVNINGCGPVIYSPPVWASDNGNPFHLSSSI